MERSTSAWNHIQWNRSMATKRSSVHPAAELAPASVAMPPRQHLLQWVTGLAEAEELVPLQTAPEVQWDKRCPPEGEAEVVHAAHDEPGAPGAAASMSRTSTYAPGVAHLLSALANY